MKIFHKSNKQLCLFKDDSRTIKKSLEHAVNRKVDLSWADLSGAKLSWADLSGADLSWADLSGADLSWADLSGAKLSGADKHKPSFWIIPGEGAFIAYKKVYRIDCNTPIILTLEIPATARRTCCLINRKCRASAAKPIKAEYLDGSPCDQMAFQNMNNKTYPTIWQIDVTKYALWFDDDIRADCRPGIHFFITKQEARNFTF